MTLVEVMVVVALSSIVMGVMISLTVALKQRDRALRSFAVESERRCELAELLRTDIRGAIEVSLPAETVLAVKRPDGGETRYELTASNCNRTVAEAGGGKRRFDSFAVERGASWSLELGPTGQRPLFVVTLKRIPRSQDTDAQPTLLLVYAALGADSPDAVAVAKTE